jgi:sugar lactone lactonase YvrE
MKGMRKLGRAGPHRRRNRWWRLGVGGLFAVVVLVASGPAMPATGGGGPSVLATFKPKAEFPEGLAVDRQGNLYVSVTTWGKTEKDPNSGRIWKISPNGRRTAFGPQLMLGGGLLTGVALDARGRVYVAHATFDNVTPAGIWRLEAGVPTRLVDFRAGSFPNGLAFHHRALYASDSALGAIWKVRAKGSATLWARSALLAPGKRGLGANGIVVRGDRLYVAVTDAGRIVSIPIAATGTAGRPVPLVASSRLKGVDGITVDAQGLLYALSDTRNTLVRVNPNGRLEQLASHRDGLLYPTTPAFGRRTSDEGVLYVVNGDFFGTGKPSLVSFEVGLLATS